MAIIKWRDSYNIGVPQSDEEHKKLVELINTMFETIRDKGDENTTRKVVEELIVYTEHHFANEEKLLEEAGYPDLAEHKDRHKQLKEEVLKFETDLENDFEKAATGLYKFMRTWLVEHIQEIDMQYAVYLKETS